jgi:hypothetical protein
MKKQISMKSPSPDELMIQGVGRIHAALRRSLDTIVRVSAAPVPAVDRAGLAEFCGRFTRFLHVHHDSEEQIIFPKLVEVATRASRPAYTSDVEGWRSDHEKLLGRLSAFETAIAGFRNGGSLASLHGTASEVREVLFPHLEAEETVLGAKGLAKLLRADEVLALDAASAKHGQRAGGPSVLLMLVHALTPDEQKEQFGGMPWLVRKVLLKRIWARSFRGSLKYAYNPALAI